MEGSFCVLCNKQYNLNRNESTVASGVGDGVELKLHVVYNLVASKSAALTTITKKSELKTTKGSRQVKANAATKEKQETFISKLPPQRTIPADSKEVVPQHGPVVFLDDDDDTMKNNEKNPNETTVDDWMRDKLPKVPQFDKELAIEKVIFETDGSADLEMVRKIIDEVIPAGKNVVTWGDIGGLAAEKRSIQEMIILPLKRPDLFKGLRAPGKGALLYGPPGTGKTLIAKCVARESNVTFISISPSTLTSKWVGESEKLVRTLFQVARAIQPSIIFLDEVDCLLGKRGQKSEHEASRKMKNEFLMQLDGCATPGNERLLVLAATNLPEEIDEAAMRRFEKRIYIPLPDKEARAAILNICMQGEKHNLSQEDFQKIADETQGYSGDDIKNLARAAAHGPLKSSSLFDIECMDAAQVRAICLKDFIEAKVKVRPSVSNETIKGFVKFLSKK